LLSIKQPAVAGMFYAAQETQLREQINVFLNAARQRCEPCANISALIAPHAGYQYSGEVAASAFASLGPDIEHIERVIIVGPAHRMAVEGLAVPSAGLFQTPLGDVAVDTDAIATIAALPNVNILDAAFAREHCIEVQLPFIQSILPTAKIVPVLAGRTTHAAVSAVLDAIWKDTGTLLVISSDLSHYHDYETARRRDAATTQVIARLDVNALAEGDACGRLPIQALMSLARERDLVIAPIDVRNSGDTAGTRDAVVGYGAYTVTPARPPGLKYRHRRQLLGIASGAIRAALDGRAREPLTQDLPPELSAQRASFVTLEINGRLRGCIGSLQASSSLAQDVAQNALRAATADPRFPALTRAEFARVDISIAVLSPPAKLSFENERQLLRSIAPGVHGLILRDGSHSATFLPAVWKSLPHADQFLSELKRKAGLAANHWSGHLQAWTYTTETFR
jgi:AmmeMemoRadiSam system protein B/AmmeMemoRadiSam system protein A